MTNRGETPLNELVDGLDEVAALAIPYARATSAESARLARSAPRPVLALNCQRHIAQHAYSCSQVIPLGHSVVEVRSIGEPVNSVT